MCYNPQPPGDPASSPMTPPPPPPPRPPPPPPPPHVSSIAKTAVQMMWHGKTMDASAVRDFIRRRYFKRFMLVGVVWNGCSIGDVTVQTGDDNENIKLATAVTRAASARTRTIHAYIIKSD